MSDQGNILLLDHDESCRQTVSDFLVSSGYSVEVVQDEKAVVRRVSESVYDAIIVGIASEADAVEPSISRIKPLGSDIEVIAITEHDSSNQSMEALSQGAYCFVQRPVRLPVLLNRVRSAAAHHAFHQSSRELLDDRDSSAVELGNRFESMQRLLRLDRDLMANLDYRRVLDVIMNGLIDLAGADTSAVLLTRDRIHSVGVSSKVGTIVPSSDAIVDTLIREWDTWGNEVIDRSTLHTSGLDDEAEGTISDCALAPLIVKDTVIGIVGAFSTGDRSLETEDSKFVPVVASRAEVVIENAFLHEHTKVLATTDSLTGLFNRSMFRENLQNEFQRAHRYRLDQRQGGELSVIMCDVDKFKNFNDTYGHQLGDEVLKSVASVLMQEARRAMDMVARYGGEEFIIVAPDTSLRNAVLLAERIRKALAEKPVESEYGELYVTASFGVSSYPECGCETPEVLVKQADDALYAAKDAGRNCVAQAPTIVESVSASEMPIT